LPEGPKKPKKKRGRPKGSTKKPKKTTAKASKAKEPQFGTELGETEPKKPKAEKPKVETKPEAPEEKPKVEAKPEEPKKETKPVLAPKPAESYSDRYRLDRIFRREMEEPEFWIGKEGLVPSVPLLSQDEEKAISSQVQIPADQTPQYKPEYILSPEFGGLSNYERGVNAQKQELEEKLRRLQSSPDSTEQEITKIEEDLKTLDYLYDNFYSGMNVFRIAKGGRDKLRE